MERLPKDSKLEHVAPYDGNATRMTGNDRSVSRAFAPDPRPAAGGRDVGLMKILRIPKVWQEFPQQYARARARYGVLVDGQRRAFGAVKTPSQRKLSPLSEFQR